MAGRDRHTANDAEPWRPIEVRSYRSFPSRRFPILARLECALRSNHPDVVHLHGAAWRPHITEATRAYCSRQGSALVFSPHGMLDPWVLRSGFSKRILLPFVRRLLRKAHVVHALNAAETAAVRHVGYRGPIAQIPNGVKLPGEELARRPPWMSANEETRRHLFFLGRLHPKKGVHVLLCAWARLLERQPAVGRAWRLVVGGWAQGDYQTKLDGLVARHALEDSVLFAGFHDEEERARALSHVDGFILPSFSEGMPMAALEAWSFGVPVLMTTECNLPEGFTAGAALRISTDPEELSHRLEVFMALSDEERRVMGERGRALVAERFTWPEVARQMVEVYYWVSGWGPQPSCIVRD